MAILESVKELASKLGAETNGRDITDQLNKINKHLDETALSGRDIAEAVKTYSENASGGGGGGETFEVNLTYNLTEQGSLVTTKSYEEIRAAYESGMKIVGIFSIPDEGFEFECAGYHEMTIDENDGILLTYFPVVNSGRTTGASIVMMDNNTAYAALGTGDTVPVIPAT